MEDHVLTPPATTPDEDQLLAEMIRRGEVTDPASARGKLLRAAVELFRREGYERTTVRDLAAAIGIQSGSIFHHFRSKPEILHAVVEECIRITTARLKAAAALHEQPADQLRALIRSELEAINGRSADALSVTVFEWRCLPEASQQELLVWRREYDAVWMDVLRRTRPELPADEIFVIRRLLMGAISWTHTWYNREGRLDLDELAIRIWNLAVPGETGSFS